MRNRRKVLNPPLFVLDLFRMGWRIGVAGEQRFLAQGRDGDQFFDHTGFDETSEAF